MELNESFKEKLIQDIQEWDLKHPIDYLWRQYFSIPFGSPEHLNASFIEQFKWYEERKFVKEMTEQAKAEKGDTDGSSVKGYGKKVDFKKYGFKGEKDVEDTRKKYDDPKKAQPLIDKLLKDKQWQMIRSTGR